MHVTLSKTSLRVRRQQIATRAVTSSLKSDYILLSNSIRLPTQDVTYPSRCFRQRTLIIQLQEPSVINYLVEKKITVSRGQVSHFSGPLSRGGGALTALRCVREYIFIHIELFTFICTLLSRRRTYNDAEVLCGEGDIL